MSRDFTALVALAGLAPDRRLLVASVLAAPFQLQTIAGSRSRRGSLSRTSPCPLADPGTRNWKRAGTPPLLFKKERSRLEQAPGHKGLPDADKRRVFGVGVVNVLVRFARVLCVCVVCVCAWLARLSPVLYLLRSASCLSINPSCGTCVSRRSHVGARIGS